MYALAFASGDVAPGIRAFAPGEFAFREPRSIFLPQGAIKG
jgi:hypothetical protein